MRVSALPFAALLCAAPAASAQVSHMFTIDFDASSFDWGGTTSIGDLETDPDTFNLDGTIELLLTTGGNPVATGELPGGGDAAVVPDLHAEIPNPVPWLPPLVEIDIENLHFVLSSPPFAVDGSGAWNTTVTGTAISGTMTIDPLVGDTTVMDLTGLSSDPTLAAGTLTLAGGDLRFVAPVVLNFHFDDPNSGVSGDLFLDGQVAADFDCPTPVNYCPLSPNSVGPGATIFATGTTSIGANDLVLQCDLLPPNQFGIFYYGPNQIQQPFGDGFRCVGGSVFRLPPLSTGGGSLSFPLDQTDLPPGGEIAVGQVVNFQCWYRDPAAGGSGFNLSDALSTGFCP